VLCLHEPPPADCAPPPLLCPRELAGHGFSALGFPRGSDGGEATGKIRVETGAGGAWYQLNHALDSEYQVEPGFSGSPVWDTSVEAVVGIVVASDYRRPGDTRPGGNAGFMIPLSMAREVWPPLDRQLGWRLRFDPQRDLHWTPQGGGGDEEAVALVGREMALEELRRWVVRSDGPLLVVTGRRGSGKSAVLSERVRSEDPAVDLAIVAEGMTLTEIATTIARWSGVDASDAESLRIGLRAQAEEEDGWEPPAIVIDQLDEADESEDVVSSLLNPLAEAGLARFAVGLPKADGESPLDRFSPTPEIVDLDDERYFAVADLEAYVAELLSRGPAYADNRAATVEVARGVAEATRPSFLVAQLVAVSLAGEAEISDGEPGSYPATVKAAMDRYVERAARREGANEKERRLARKRMRDLLTALVYAVGPGLPADGEAWAAVADTVAGEGLYGPGDVRWLREGPAGYLLRRVEVAGTAYGGLFHPALAAALSSDDLDPAPMHERIAAALSELPAARGDGSEDPYVSSRLSGHVLRGAAWAGLAGRPDVLDRLEPRALSADARRAVLRGDDLPAEILGVLNYGRQLASSRPPDRRGLRQMGMARVSGYRRFGRAGDASGIFDWEVISAVLRQHPAHVTISGETAVHGLVAVPDERGPLLAAACGDGRVRLWRAATGEPLGGPPPGSQPLRAIATCELDGAGQIVWGDERGVVQVWSPAQGGDPIRVDSDHRGGIRALAAFAAAGVLYFASAGDDHEVRLWSGSHKIARLGVDAPVRALAARGSETDAEVLAGDDSGRVGLWRLGAAKLAEYAEATTVPRLDPAGPPLTGPTDWIRTVCAFGDGRKRPLAAAGDDGAVYVWDDPQSDHGARAAGSHDGPVLASAAYAAAADPRLATTGGDRTVRLWDPGAGGPIGQPLTGHQNEVRALAAYELEGAASIASAGDGGTLRIWDPRSAERIAAPAEVHERAVTAVAACETDRGTVVVTGDENGDVRCWDPATGEPVTDGFAAHRDAIRLLVPYPGAGEVGIASGGDDEVVHFRGIFSGAELAPSLTGHSGPVRALALDTVVHGAAAIASGSEDGTVRLWRVEKNHEEIPSALSRHGGPVRGLGAFELPGHGSCLAVAGFGRGIEVRLASAPEVVVGPVEAHTDWVMAVELVRSGLAPEIVTCGDDGCVRIFAPLRKAPPRLLGAHDGPARALAVLDCGGRTLIASGGEDGTIRLWSPDGPPGDRCLQLGVAVNAICQLDDGLLVGTAEGHLVVDFAAAA
jgi:WD40 repeat protein